MAKEDVSLEEYKTLIKTVMSNNASLQRLQQHNMMIEGSLQTLEKLHGYDRQGVAKELSEASV